MAHQLNVAILALTLLGTADAQDVPRSQFVVIGDVSTLLVGQDGYCGAMERVDKEDLKKIAVPSGRRTWVRYVQGGAVTGTCSLDFSFSPHPGEAYIARYTTWVGRCQVDLFRVRPGQDPSPEGLTPERKRSCLLP